MYVHKYILTTLIFKDPEGCRAKYKHEGSAIGRAQWRALTFYLVVFACFKLQDCAHVLFYN